MWSIILRFLMSMYRNQSVIVRWNGAHYDTFSVRNGVKQGSVLSPVLFNIYLDDLISELHNQDVGCHFAGHFVGCFIYADDITVLVPSHEALSDMLHVCREYTETHDILFIANKTKCVYFDKF